MEKIQLSNLIAMKKKFSKMTMHSEKKTRNRRYRWWGCRIDIDEQKNRNYSYIMRGYRRSLKSKWSTKEKKYECTSKWCYRLLVRNHLTFRTGTHVGQELSENYWKKCSNS